MFWRKRQPDPELRGIRVVVDNTRADIATDDVLERLDEALGLISQYQPWRLEHLRRDITAATVASSIVHEGIHARVDLMGVKRENRNRAKEERLCRRAELEFGRALPLELGRPVIERALATLTLEDEEVAPEIDWAEAQAKQEAIDRLA